MDSFEWNRMAGAFLAALLSLLALSILTDEFLMRPEVPQQKGYVVAGVEAEADAGEAAPAEAEPPVEVFLASADLARGEAAFKKCAACHSINEGGANGVGPNLWGIVGAPHARVAGFQYSDALAARKGEPWSWAALDAWLRSPKAAIPGNRMAFAGIGRPQERADLLVYLNSKSSRPLPIPAAPPPAAEATADAPAEAATTAPAEAAAGAGAPA
ncbi:c-type cytochrome [Thermaurantiacus sp.]